MLFHLGTAYNNVNNYNYKNYVSYLQNCLKDCLQGTIL
jgi:hypothetical protein